MSYPNPENQPYSGDHPAPGYPAPQYPYPHPPAYLAPAPPPRKRRTWLVVALVTGGVLLLCCGVTATLAAPFLREYPATVTTPASLAGLNRQHNPEIDRLGEQLGADLKDRAKVDTAVAGLYAENTQQSRLVLVIGASGLVMSPDEQVEDAFEGMSGSGLAVSGVTAYDAGELGGTVKCGTGSVSGLPLSVCAWGDHGSIGMGVFYDRPVADSANLFLEIRDGMVDRG